MEDYKEKYENALSWARSAINAGANGLLKEDLQYIFPELKESEDERIRKWCINLIKQTCDYDSPTSRKEVDDALAWLEKQGEKKPTCILDNSKSNVKFPFKAKVKSNGKIVTIHAGQLSTNAKKWIRYQSDVEDGYMVYRPEDLELVCNIEQKPTDKVEPKFKVGNWYLCVKDFVGKGVRFDKGHTYYCGLDGCLQEFDTGAHIDIDEKLYDYFNLWTIKDAKDGDIIFSNDGHGTDSIELIRIISDNRIKFWFCLSSKNKFKDCHYEVSNGDIPYTNFASRKDATPTTKEQRDLLFQKMYEAGYEWDAEKKELEKIEQKHICKLDNSYTCVKFPFKAKVKSSGKIVTIHDGQLSYDGKKWTKYQSDKEDGYKIYEPNNLELVCETEQKSLWSEEDEKHLLGCINYFTGITEYSPYYKDFLWLKSLKDRYIWKPSDEQMRELGIVATGMGWFNKDVLSGLLEQLKKLREE